MSVGRCRAHVAIRPTSGTATGSTAGRTRWMTRDWAIALMYPPTRCRLDRRFVEADAIPARAGPASVRHARPVPEALSPVDKP
ncbi:hypothetical protein GCM10023263_46890 [Phytohabitans rumicis]